MKLLNTPADAYNKSLTKADVFLPASSSKYMKTYTFLLSLMLLCACTQAQTATYYTIRGRVTDAVTGKPLQAASVFAQHSTLGTATDSEGQFTLWLPKGGYELAFTFTGYETVTRRVSGNEDSGQALAVTMKVREQSLEEVAVKSSNEVKDGLEKYGGFFTDQFIGATPNSRECRLLNREALKFYFSKKRNRLKVLAPDQPLVLENKALGYRIRYALDSFTYDYTTHTSLFAGYPLFEMMQPATAEEESLWKQNRQLAYRGSILHFMRSLYQRSLQEEGFEVQFIVQYRERDTAISGLNYYAAMNYSLNDSTRVVEVMPNQPQVAILYKKEKPAAEYLQLNTDAPAQFELSIVQVPAGQAIGIEENGYYFDQQDLSITGYWSWEKMADMLPYDYRE
jgi:hypothetical protein